jgi:hypothetical protein
MLDHNLTVGIDQALAMGFGLVESYGCKLEFVPVWITGDGIWFGSSGRVITDMI